MPVPLHWHSEPLLLLTIIGTGWLYALCVGPFREKIAPGQPFPRLQATLFTSGLIIGYIAVGSPIDQIGEDFLFSVHMVQHMLLIYVMPPLFLLGTPTWLADAILAWKPLRKVWRVLTHPVFAALFFNICYTLWHIPDLYELALRDKWIHILEHWTMFVPAIWFWWPLLSPSSRLPPIAYGARMLYIFILMVLQLPVFAFLTLSEEVLYPTYEYAARITSLDPLQDQILGGLIMKLNNMVVSLTMLAICFYLWYQKDQRDSTANDARLAQKHLRRQDG